MRWVDRGRFTRVNSEAIKAAAPIGSTSHSVQKAPGEFVSTFSFTLQNVADGSRYRIEDTADNGEIASGVQSGTSNIVIAGIGYAGSPRTLRIKVRKATGSPKYQPFETLTVVGASGGAAYIVQIPDPIA